MNIKGLTPALATLDPRARVEGKENVRLQNSGDRDANGQRQEPEPEHKRHLSDVEFEVAIQTLKEHSGVVAHGLIVRVETNADSRVIFIEDQAGKIVRRLSEADLWLVTKEKNRTTGSILDKAG